MPAITELDMQRIICSSSTGSITDAADGARRLHPHFFDPAVAISVHHGTLRRAVPLLAARVLPPPRGSSPCRVVPPYEALFLSPPRGSSLRRSVPLPAARFLPPQRGSSLRRAVPPGILPPPRRSSLRRAVPLPAVRFLPLPCGSCLRRAIHSNAARILLLPRGSLPPSFTPSKSLPPFLGPNLGFTRSL